MPSQKRILITVTLPVEVKKSKKWHIASCCPLDVHTQGETKERALENLKEALEMFLGSCLERGTFDKVMQESGITVNQEEVKESIESRPNYLDVPLYLTSTNQFCQSCHA